MHKLLLSEDGVFPIVRDEDGVLLKNLPETGIDIPGTIQGEGKLAGMPSLFVRLAGCNLRCEWILPDGSKSKCDTAYASFELVNVRQECVDVVARLVRNNLENISHVVITGGEPFLQANALAEFCCDLKRNKGIHITIETNGTLFDNDVANYVDLFSISPKLSYSLGGKSVEDLEIEVQRFIDFVNKNKGKELQLKFVVSTKDNELEIKNFLSKLNYLDNSDVLIMPAGDSEELLSISSPVALTMAIKNGWRFCWRLHVSLFGNKKGV